MLTDEIKKQLVEKAQAPGIRRMHLILNMG